MDIKQQEMNLDCNNSISKNKDNAEGLNNTSVEKASKKKPQDFAKLAYYAKKERMQELAVITNGKKLCEYIYTITQNSPKKFRWSLVAKLQDCSFEYVRKLYYANELPPRARIVTLLEAQSLIKILDFNCQMSKSCGAITHKQFNHIAELIYDCRVTLRGWTKNASAASALKVEADTKNE